VDLSWMQLDAYVSLLSGGAFAIWAAVGLARAKSEARAGMLVWLTIAAAFMAVGLVGVMETVGPRWFNVSRNTVFGVFFMMYGTNGLFTKATDRAAYWLFLVVGTGCMLLALYGGLGTFWS
jgi:hypothetical protein